MNYGKILVAIGVLTWWEGLRRFGLVSSLLLASPSEILQAALQANVELLSAVHVTLLEILAAVSITWVCGIVIGLPVGISPFARRYVAPLLSSIFSIPKIMFYPLMLVWLGIGPQSKIGFAVFTSFFTVALTTIDAVGTIDHRYAVAARSFGATRLHLLYGIYLPLALPGIISGLRIGTALVVIGVVVSEMLASFEGLGFWISTHRSSFDTPQVYLGILLALLLSMGINALLGRLERRFSNWRDDERTGHRINEKSLKGTTL